MDNLNLPEVKEPLYFRLFHPSLLHASRTPWDEVMKPTKDNPELHKQTWTMNHFIDRTLQKEWGGVGGKVTTSRNRANQLLYLRAVRKSSDQTVEQFTDNLWNTPTILPSGCQDYQGCLQKTSRSLLRWQPGSTMEDKLQWSWEEYWWCCITRARRLHKGKRTRFKR